MFISYISELLSLSKEDVTVLKQPKCSLSPCTVLIIGTLIVLGLCLIKTTITVVNTTTKLMKTPNRDFAKRVEPQRCTFALLREISARDHQFPSGEWKIVHGQPYYEPDFCVFKHQPIPEGYVQTCMRRATMGSVWTWGDSTSKEYNNALMASFGARCQETMRENLTKSVSIPDIQISDSTQLNLEEYVHSVVQLNCCPWCECNVHKCSFGKVTNSIFFKLMKPSKMISSGLKTYKGTQIPTYFLGRDGKQQYLHNYPDIIIVYLSMTYATNKTSIAQQIVELENFNNLVQNAMPSTTKIFYIPIHPNIQDLNETSGRKQLSENEFNLNQILFDIIGPDLVDKSGRTFGFMDVFPSSQYRMNWNEGNTSVNSPWYKQVIMMFWETFCNSVVLNKFH
jgi:hypothetical protein